MKIPSGGIFIVFPVLLKSANPRDFVHNLFLNCLFCDNVVYLGIVLHIFFFIRKSFKNFILILL